MLFFVASDIKPLWVCGGTAVWSSKKVGNKASKEGENWSEEVKIILMKQGCKGMRGLIYTHID